MEEARTFAIAAAKRDRGYQTSVRTRKGLTRKTTDHVPTKENRDGQQMSSGILKEGGLTAYSKA